MPVEMKDVPLWLLTSLVGALIIKLLDLVFQRRERWQSARQTKAQAIVDYIDQFGELTELYRFHAYASTEIIRGKRGAFKKDRKGNFLTKTKLLEPEPRFAEAIEAIKGVDIDSAISHKIASIRLNSPEAIDLSLELDPKGDIRKLLNELYTHTVFSIEQVLKNRPARGWGKSVENMFNALKEADEARRQVRRALSKFLP